MVFNLFYTIFSCSTVPRYSCRDRTFSTQKVKAYRLTNQTNLIYLDPSVGANYFNNQRT